MMIGRAPRESNPKWLQSQCMEIKSRGEMDEKMEEKRKKEGEERRRVGGYLKKWRVGGDIMRVGPIHMGCGLD